MDIKKIAATRKPPHTKSIPVYFERLGKQFFSIKKSSAKGFIFCLVHPISLIMYIKRFAVYLSSFYITLIETLYIYGKGIDNGLDKKDCKNN